MFSYLKNYSYEIFQYTSLIDKKKQQQTRRRFVAEATRRSSNLIVAPHDIQGS